MLFFVFIDLGVGVDIVFGEWNVCDDVFMFFVLFDIIVNKLFCDIYGRLKIRCECIRLLLCNGN